MTKTLTTLGLAFILTTGYVAAEAKSPAAIAGTVNDMEITVAEADKALSILTKGQKTWATLPEDAKKQLIEMMAPKKLAAVAAEKGLTAKEKEAAIAGFWMQKKMSSVGLSDDEVKAAYDKMVEAAKAAKSKQQIPPFEAAKNSIVMQLKQEKVVSELMKNAKIKLKQFYKKRGSSKCL